MRKKTIKILVDQLESTYNDKFVVKNTIPIQTTPVKHLVEFHCEKAVGVCVIFSSNFFGTEVNDIKDNYMMRARSQEILSAIEDVITPILASEFKIVFIPGSNVDLGTHNYRTPIETIIAELDGYDEFIILSKDEITPEIAEKIKSELECKTFSFTTYLLGHVEHALYDSIDEKYFDNNEIVDVSANCISITAEEGQYIIEDMKNM